MGKLGKHSKTLIIASTTLRTNYSFAYNLSYETFSLYKEAQKIYDKTLLVNPLELIYKFKEGKPAQVLSLGKEVIRGDTLIVRSVFKGNFATALLARYLRLDGCDVIDSMARFTGARHTKIFSSLRLHAEGMGVSSFMAFRKEQAVQLLSDLHNENTFPVIAKPAIGSKGRGIRLLKDKQSALQYIEEFFGDEQESEIPLLIQDFVEFIQEYRVLVILGEPIGVVLKIPKPGAITANAASGAEFVAVSAPDVCDFAKRSVSPHGILGVDVGVDNKGRYRIIEANWVPGWRAFEAATGINVAREVVERCYYRLLK